MAGEEKKHRDSLKVTDDGKDDAKAPPPDRDQSTISPQRAHDVADRAEFSDIPEAQDTDEPGETLLERDNMQGSPSAQEEEKAVSGDRRGAAKKR